MGDREVTQGRQDLGYARFLFPQEEEASRLSAPLRDGGQRGQRLGHIP